MNFLGNVDAMIFDLRDKGVVSILDKSQGICYNRLRTY
jgi:hypothetical protein